MQAVSNFSGPCYKLCFFWKYKLAQVFFLCVLNFYSLGIKYKFKIHNYINCSLILKVRKIKIINAKYKYKKIDKTYGDYLFGYCYIGIVCIWSFYI